MLKATSVFHNLISTAWRWLYCQSILLSRLSTRIGTTSLLRALDGHVKMWIVYDDQVHGVLF